MSNKPPQTSDLKQQPLMDSDLSVLVELSWFCVLTRGDGTCLGLEDPRGGPHPPVGQNSVRVEGTGQAARHLLSAWRLRQASDSARRATQGSETSRDLAQVSQILCSIIFTPFCWSEQITLPDSRQPQRKEVPDVDGRSSMQQNRAKSDRWPGSKPNYHPDLGGE